MVGTVSVDSSTDQSAGTVAAHAVFAWWQDNFGFVASVCMAVVVAAFTRFAITSAQVSSRVERERRTQLLKAHNHKGAANVLARPTHEDRIAHAEMEEEELNEEWERGERLRQEEEAEAEAEGEAGKAPSTSATTAAAAPTPMAPATTNPLELGGAELKVVYGTVLGKAAKFAKELAATARERFGLRVAVHNAAELGDDVEDILTNDTCPYVFIMSTYTDGRPAESAAWFHDWLVEASYDFRYDKEMLSQMRYTVFGLGNALYEENFNAAARTLDSALHRLGARRIAGMGSGDENVATSPAGDIERDFTAWLDASWAKMVRAARNRDVWDAEADALVESNSEEEDDDDDDDDDDGEGSDAEVDLEDMGKVANALETAKEQRRKEEAAGKGSGGGGVVEEGVVMVTNRKGKKKGGDVGSSAQGSGEEASEAVEMVTPALRKALTKQGYRIVGSHSGVKLCRWTKSMLRGRGGCYKHTFYGIESHRCMESTPSLACANKCVFCWRHHTNPVGTEWRWKVSFSLFSLMNDYFDLILIVFILFFFIYFVLIINY